MASPYSPCAPIWSRSRVPKHLDPWLVPQPGLPNAKILTPNSWGLGGGHGTGLEITQPHTVAWGNLAAARSVL